MDLAAERRGTFRRTTLKGGEIVFNNLRSTVNCTVRNLSDKGAKLKVSSVLGIPDSFELVLAGQERRQARVIWRSLNEIGVEFEVVH